MKGKHGCSKSRNQFSRLRAAYFILGASMNEPVNPEPVKINRSEHIRKLLEVYGPTASPMRIVNELAEKNIKITPNLVSELKNRMFKTRKETAVPAKKPERWDMILKVKKLVDEVGSIDEMRDILALLEELKS
jgi:histidyl-tRNA synthetase